MSISNKYLLEALDMPPPKSSLKLPTLSNLQKYFLQPASNQIPEPVLCRYFRNGGCDKGAHCRFVHDSKETRTKYKTQLCSKFMEGHCKFGDTCSFAHGDKDKKY